MNVFKEFKRDERGVTFTLGYILDIMIMGLLLAGIIMGVSTMIDTNHSQAVRYQSDVVSSQVSARVTAVDNLDINQQETNVVLELDTPDRIIGKQYFVRLVDPGSEQPYVEVHVPKTNTTQTTPINVDADIVESSVTGNTVRVKYVERPGSEPEVTLVGSDGGGL